VETTVQVKEADTVPPLPSLAVIRVENGLEFAAVSTIVPVMRPAEDMVNPSGRLLAVKVRESLSGSEKTEATERDTRLPVLSDLLVRLVAIGGLLAKDTVQPKEVDTVPPLPSLAVTRVVNRPELAAKSAMVPEMVPLEETASPSGNPVAVKVRVSLSGSENEDATENETCLPVVSDLLERDEATGGRLGAKTVQVKAAVTVPPLPSLAVMRVE